MSLNCDWCQRPIEGKYYRFEDGDLCCAGCHDANPPCDRCGKPLRGGWRWTVEDGTVELCKPCSEAAKRCTACGVPLLGTYYSLPRSPDRRFCERCMHHRDRCDFCAMPLAGGGVVYGDGRMSCNDCRATAVVKQDELDTLDREARRWYADRFGIHLRSREECPARLADAAFIAQLQDRHFEATPGFDARENGLFQARVQTTTRGDELIAREEDLAIWVESGLPRQESFGTLVHELGHLWQFDAFGGVRPEPRIIEGAACWFQFHALADRGATAEAERVASSRDPIYGDGFRLIRAIEERHGFRDTLGVVLAHLKPPA